MKHILLIVGSELHINDPFLNYIRAQYNRHFGESPLIFYVRDGDNELPFKIQNHAKYSELITVVANEANFATIAKILSTLSNDNLELKDDTLMPSRASISVNGSFVISLEDAQINLLKATPTQTLPPFLLSLDSKAASFNLLDIDKDSALLVLKELGATYNVNVLATNILERLIYVKAISQKFGQLDSFLDEAKKAFINQFIDSDNIVDFIVSRLKAQNLSITLAESCTAGMGAAMIGAVPGASEIFAGSVVSYSNHIKNIWLNVDESILNEHGAVSAPCVEAMAKGALELCGSDFAISISGIAGPGGGSDAKPVGTVYIGAASKDIVYSRCLHLSGDRDYIRTQSALSAYALLLSSFWTQICSSKQEINKELNDEE